jgi:hypothetical protein
MELTHIWRGMGSAIFLEFGDLHNRVWKNGRVSSNSSGEMGVSLTWSWRLEGRRRIWCGSWSEDSDWPRFFRKIIGSRLLGISTFGRLPELDLHLSCGLHVLSFMTADGEPEWGIHDNREGKERWLGVKYGRLHCEREMLSFPKVRKSRLTLVHPPKKD